MRAWIAVPAVVALSLAGNAARADAPPPEGYYVHQDGTTVTVFLETYPRTCPDQGLLRKSVDTGEVVKITTCLDDRRFVDECVPAGHYQYGLAVALECHSASGTAYFGEATVTGGAGPECTRTVAVPEAADASAVPWGSDPMVCASHYHGPGYGCATGGAAVLGGNLAILLTGLALWRRRARRGARE
jgi:hypothetical protein